MEDVPKYLKALRLATRNAHTAVERASGVKSLFSNSPDLNVYKRLIATHYFYHLVVAKNTATMAKVKNTFILDWPDCSRISQLENDLSLLGMSTQKESFIPQYTSPAFTVGLCYVSEGSCLGNQMIYRSLKGNPVFEAWGAAEFLKGCTDSIHQRWASFLEVMSVYGQNHYEELEKGAMAGFSLFQQTLKEFSHICIQV